MKFKKGDLVQITKVRYDKAIERRGSAPHHWDRHVFEYYKKPMTVVMSNRDGIFTNVMDGGWSERSLEPYVEPVYLPEELFIL